MKLHLYSHLVKETGFSRNTIERYIHNAPLKYKVYTIPKRSSGQRVIAHPARKLKIIQRALISILVPFLNVHTQAMAYKKGIGIKNNAGMHKGNDYLLKLDFNDFFNSITPDMFLNLISQNNITLSPAEKNLIIKSFFWNKTKRNDGKLVLSVGAPSSPFLSNIIMYDFDCYFSDFCKRNNIVYSRYADDLTFSTSKKNILSAMPNLVKKQLSILYKNKITINEFKTIFSSKAHNRHVTGVTINNNGELSLGRERKRLISSMIHKFMLKILSAEQSHKLQGLVSFANDIEPAFKLRMEKKYSKEVISQVIKYRGSYE